MVATEINKGGVPLWFGLWPFQVAWWHLDVAAQYFAEILK